MPVSGLPYLYFPSKMDKAQGSVQYLPRISSSSRIYASTDSSPRAGAPPLSLPHLSSAATKADRYNSLTQFDKKGIGRFKAHVRNALKTTDDLERISRQLKQHLKRFKGASKNKVSFDRLSIYRDAFEEIIKTSAGKFAPLLQEIKDTYNQHLVRAISRQEENEPRKCSAENHPVNRPEIDEGSKDLLHLKKQLHHLEVESRVLLQENSRLREELVKEKEIHSERKQKEMESLEMIEFVQHQPATPQTSSRDYAEQIESLQLQIAEERRAIAKVISERKGRIPLSVCHNLEQCLREVEIETQKCQRHNKHLCQEIEKWKRALWEQLQTQGYSDHYREIWERIITTQ